MKEAKIKEHETWLQDIKEWFNKLVRIKKHIISRFGVTYIYIATRKQTAFHWLINLDDKFIEIINMLFTKSQEENVRNNKNKNT